MSRVAATAAPPTRDPNKAIRTIAGDLFWPLEAQLQEISIDVIAHALSQINRFTGHTREPYSVAQHSVMVSRLCPKEFALWGLLHDAAEAFLGDVSRPLKHQAFMDGYRQAEDRLQRLIFDRFGLIGPVPAEVKAADDGALHAELRDLVPGSDPRHAQIANAANIPAIVPQRSQRARDMFMQRFRVLDATRASTV